MVKDGVAEVEVLVELLEDTEPLSKCFLVGYFMNGSAHWFDSRHYKSNLNAAGKKPKVYVQFIGKTTVLFRIEDTNIRNKVLRMKFWQISEVPLMVGVWSPETASYPPDLLAIPLRVDLEHVPGYLYSKSGVYGR